MRRARRGSRREHRPRHRRERHARRQRRASCCARDHEVVAVSRHQRGHASAGRRSSPADLAAPGVADALLARAPPGARAALRRAHRRRPLRGRSRRSPTASTPSCRASLAAACRRRGARLIHVSTDAVYGGPGPHREDASPGAGQPSTPRSKLRGEDARARPSCPARWCCARRMHGWRPAPRTSFSEAILRGLLRRRAAAALRRRALLAARCRGDRRAGRCDCARSGWRGRSTSARPTPSTRRSSAAWWRAASALDPDADRAHRPGRAPPGGRRARSTPPWTSRRLTAVAGAPPTVAEGVARLRRELEDGTAAAIRGGSGRTLVELLGREAA